LEFVFFLDTINLGFLLREKLADVLIIPSSWGSQLDGDLHHQHRAASRIFLAPLPGKKKTSARGVLHAHPLLCFSFAFTLFLLASFYKKYTKKLVSFIVVFTCLLLALLEWVLMRTPSCVILLALIVILSALLLRHLLLLLIFMRLSLLC
jgi:hypothetical protein